jgi:hypothetical protein
VHHHSTLPPPHHHHQHHHPPPGFFRYHPPHLCLCCSHIGTRSVRLREDVGFHCHALLVGVGEGVTGVCLLAFGAHV